MNSIKMLPNNGVGLTENFQQIEPLQLIRVESSWPVALFPSRGGTLDSQQLVEQHQQLLTTVTTALSCHLTMYTFPSQEQSYKFLRSFMSSLFDVNISEVLPLRFSRTVPVAHTLRSDNFFNVSELVKKLSKYIS
ncbi:hypothetical protein T12_12536 [Trichinella patagoniensis]|uniref:Uncharacterized protein n=1 Tax=Trichinella patagoniensis TaxID=990121 RepID=A0A0V0ZJA9_9BILA|nr:hypothetical protein T12_17071 [Trichinella patagoniensis]KRY21608.1 hypothetical protein T12_12536 [Trichinella patagoniensis]